MFEKKRKILTSPIKLCCCSSATSKRQCFEN